LLAVPATARAADRCGRASAPAGAGTLELSLWQPDRGTPSEHATLSIPSRDDRFVMVLFYRPARGQIGTTHYVQAFAFAPWAQQVRVGDVLTISAGGARWQGPPRITGLSSSSGRKGAAAEYLVAGDQAQADPALIRAFAAGGKVRLDRVTKDGSRIKADVALPRPKALGKAYQAARTQAAAALGPCPPSIISPISAP
jgi:hypothetical protein